MTGSMKTAVATLRAILKGKRAEYKIADRAFEEALEVYDAAYDGEEPRDTVETAHFNMVIAEERRHDIEREIGLLEDAIEVLEGAE